MRNSIAYRILFILIFLTFLFTLNTILSGVTNSQVQLSASIMSGSFVSLEFNQVKLVKEIGQIDVTIQTYISAVEDSKSEKASQMILNSVNQANINVTAIADISNEFSTKTMNSVLSESYVPYQSDIEMFFQQATMMAEFIKSDNRASAEDSFKNYTTSLNSMMDSEQKFQKVLNDCIEHETGLIGSRVTRSTIIIWVMAIVYVISGAIAFYISMKTIITPLKGVNGSLHEIILKLEEDEGDLTTRIDYRSEDEVGQIAKGINRFLETLQQAMISIKSGSNLIQISTETISNHIIECKDSTCSISSALNEMSASIEEISSTLQIIDNGAQDVLLGANTIANAAKSNSDHVATIAEHAKKIRYQSNQSKEQTEVVLQEIGNTMAASIEKSRSVKKINELITNILGISAQTNLLALNASIEAARAGSAGKGFSVVAEEIRKLAESTKQTANSIQSISALVTDAVEELVRNANEIMSYITKKVLSDYDGFVDVANTYKQDADTINEMLVNFSAKSGELRIIATEMATGIKDITIAVGDSVNVVIQSNEDTNILFNSISTITDEATHNWEIVNELNEEVSKFKKVEN